MVCGDFVTPVGLVGVIEYKHAVAEAARLRAIREPYQSQVRAEILDRMRAKYGPHWPSDSGGRWMLMGLVRKAVLERFGL